MPDELPASAQLPETALSLGGGQSFQQLAAAYLREYLDKIRLSVARLDDEALWWRPAPGTNSAGNLLLHLAGNLSMWVLDGIGGRPYERRRAEEFTAEGTAGKQELLDRLTGVIEECIEVITALPVADLDARYRIQTYDTDVRAALFHAVEHMSYHTGQIVWIAKQHLASRGAEGFEFYPRHAGE